MKSNIDLSGLRILVVDDESAILELREMQLKNLGFSYGNVLCYSNPLLAIQRIQRDEPYHFVLTDFNMPGATGYTVIEAAKNKNAGTIAILNSAVAENENVCDNADFFLQKPFDFEKLAELIKKIALKVQLKEHLASIFT